MIHLSFRKFSAKGRLALTGLRTEIAQLVPKWKWRIDGIATAAVLIVMLLDRTKIKFSIVGPWMNVVALFCVGLILHRHLGRRGRTAQRRPGLIRKIFASRSTRN